MRCYANETLTCVTRYTGKYMLVNGKAFQYAMYREGTGDTVYLAVHWLQASGSAAVWDVLRCRAGTEMYDFAVLEGWEDPVCVMPYLTDETGEGGLLYEVVTRDSGYGLYYNDMYHNSLPLYPKDYQTLPQMVVPEVVMAAGYGQSLRWKITPGDGRNGWCVNLELRYREPGADVWETEALFTESLHGYYRMTIGSHLLGKEVCLMLEYRTYGTDWGGYNLEDFVTLNRAVTPWQTVERDAAIPLQPEEIGVSMLLAGGRVTVQWSAVTDPLNLISGYRLERAAAGTDGVPENFVQLYNGTSAQFRDTLPGDAGNVVYRVCAVNRAGTQSPWTETGILEVAQSNLYVSRGGKWIRAAGVWIGEKRASPMARIR